MAGPELNLFLEGLDVYCSLESSLGPLERCLEGFYIFITTTNNLHSNNNWYFVECLLCPILF